MKQQVQYYNSRIHWIFNDKFHRYVDLPSQYYFSNRKLIAVYYSQHGKVHRTNGSAFINYKYKIKQYFYQNRCYANLEEILMVKACG